MAKQPPKTTTATGSEAEAAATTTAAPPARAYCSLTYLGHPSLGAEASLKLERGSMKVRRGESVELWLGPQDRETLTVYEPPRWTITETKPPEDPNRRAATRAKKG